MTSPVDWMCEQKYGVADVLRFCFFMQPLADKEGAGTGGMAKQCFRFTARSNTLFLFFAGPVYRHQEPMQNAAFGQPCLLTSMWRPDYKFLAGRQALFQANAGDQRLRERFPPAKVTKMYRSCTFPVTFFCYPVIRNRKERGRQKPAFPENG